MSKEELSFEELPDGSKIITIQGINQFGEKYIRQERIKCPAAWDALKRLTYTAEDMEAFAEWSYKQSYRKMWNKGKYIGYSGMLELWEKERREK